MKIRSASVWVLALNSMYGLCGCSSTGGGGANGIGPAGTLPGSSQTDGGSQGLSDGGAGHTDGGIGHTDGGATGSDAGTAPQKGGSIYVTSNQYQFGGTTSGGYTAGAYFYQAMVGGSCNDSSV